MKKRAILACIFMVIIFSITGCEGNRLTEEEKEELIQGELGYVTISYEGNIDSYGLDLDSLTLVEETKEEDYISGTYEVKLSDECFEKTGEYNFIFERDEESWFISDFSIEEESVRVISVPDFLNPQSEIESKYTLDSVSSIQSDEPLGFVDLSVDNTEEVNEYKNGLGCIYNVKGDAKLASMDGNVEYVIVLEEDEENEEYVMSTWIEDENAGIEWKDTLLGRYRTRIYSMNSRYMEFSVSKVRMEEGNVYLSITNRKNGSFSYDDEEIKLHPITKGGYADNTYNTNYQYADYILTYNGFFAPQNIEIAGNETFTPIEKVSE